LHGVMHAKPSKDMHHIIAIRKDSTQRMQRGNWLAVCGEHHEELEGNELEGMACKRWSEANYVRLMDGGEAWVRLLVARHARLRLRGYLETISFVMTVRRQKSRKESKGCVLTAAETCPEKKAHLSDAVSAKKQS
jgi:hypothetical protein